MENIYEVYALLDSNKCITGIESTAFHTKEELIEKGYIKIDEGSNGDIYGHAQPNYLHMKYGKQMYDEQMRCNFKYIENEVVELTDLEKADFNPPVIAQPSEIELLKEQQERTDAALQDLILMSIGGE